MQNEIEPPRAARDLINEALHAQRMKQKELATMANIKIPTLNMFLNGHRKMTQPTLEACAAVLKLSVESLVEAQKSYDDWCETPAGRRMLILGSNSATRPAGGILSNIQIEHHLDADEVKIEGFDPTNLQLSSYDLTRGEFKRLIKDYPSYDRNVELVLEPNDTVIVTAVEKIELPDFISARGGGVSFHLRHGVCAMFGLQLDPNYSGHPFALVRNFGFERFIMPPGEPFLSIEFNYLSTVPG